MFLTFYKNYKDEYVFVVIKNSANEIINADILQFQQIGYFNNKCEFDDDVNYLSIVDRDTDRLKLANRAMSFFKKINDTQFQYKIIDRVQSWSSDAKKNGYPVLCVETGEQYNSIKEAVDKNNLTYSALCNHLRGMKGYKTVKGKTYRKI